MTKKRVTSLLIYLAFAIIAGGIISTGASAEVPLETNSPLASAAVSGIEEDIPIGAVMDWWRPTGTTPLPEGFMLCDGSQVTADYSPIQGLSLPDLENKFIRGVSNPGSLPSAGYTTGGDDQTTHSYSFSHDHSISHKHDDVSGNSGTNSGYTGYTCLGGPVPWMRLAYSGHEHPFTVEFDQFTGDTVTKDLEFDTQSATRLPDHVGLLKLCWVGKEYYSVHLPLVVKSSSTNSPDRPKISASPAASLFGHVEVGMVIDWWRPDETTLQPDGYLVCDGSVINDPDSPINGQTLPDLTDKYIRGLTNPAGLPAAGFSTGGSPTHSHTVDPASHTHTIPGHETDTTTGTTSTHVIYWGVSGSQDLPVYDHTHPLYIDWDLGGQTGSQNYSSRSTTTNAYTPKYIRWITLGTFLAAVVGLFVTQIAASNSQGSESINDSARIPEAQASLSGLPVGTVVDWWRPETTTPIPENYMICDGSQVTDTDSPLNGKTLPSLNARFSRGVTDAGTLPAYGYTAGGSDNHTHTVNLPNHTHSFSHKHETESCQANQASYSTLNVSGWTCEVFPDEMHVHKCNDKGYESSTEGGTSGGKGNSALASQAGTFLPEYVGLLKLCKIK